MSTHKSTGMTPEGLTPTPLDATICGGRVRSHICKYAGKGTEVADDKIELMVLKKGQKLLPHLGYVHGDLVDNSITAIVDGVATAAELNVATSLLGIASVLDVDAETASRTLYATINGAIPVGKTVVFGIFYAQV